MQCKRKSLCEDVKSLLAWNGKCAYGIDGVDCPFAGEYTPAPCSLGHEGLCKAMPGDWNGKCVYSRDGVNCPFV